MAVEIINNTFLSSFVISSDIKSLKNVLVDKEERIWCAAVWNGIPDNPYVDEWKCKTCKNYLLKIGGGKCWELDYEGED